MDTEADLRQRKEALEGENAELRAKVERLEGERRAAGTAAAGVGGLWILGPNLVRAFSNFQDRAKLGEPLPRPETAELAAAIVRRAFNVGLIGLVIAALPLILLWQQNGLIARQNAYFQEQNNSIQEQNQTIREQVEQQASDARIARRAQLLDIIYGEECVRPEEVRRRLADGSGEEPGGGDGDENPTKSRCWPKAPIRARAEAAVAFLEIERGNGVERPNLQMTHLTDAHLREADLSGTDLFEANLSGADLSGAELRAANLSGADLFEADLSEANFSWANLSRADLRWANLSGADLRDAILFEANLSRANLRRADFRWTNLREAILSGADLHTAFLGTAEILTHQLELTFGGATTHLPEGVEWPEHWKLPHQEQQDIIAAKLEARQYEREEP